MMMGRWRGLCRLLLIVATLMAVLGVGCTRSEDRPVAIVNGDRIPRKVYEAALREKEAQLKAQAPHDTAPIVAALRKQVLDDLIIRQLFIQAARKAKVEVLREDVDRQLDAVRARFQGDGFDGFLRDRKMTADELRSELADNIRVMKFRENLLKDATVDDAEARRYYDANPAAFREPETYRVRLIPVRSEADGARILDELRAKQVSFETLTTGRWPGVRAVAGELGWTAAETFPSGIAEAIRQTPPGNIGGPAPGREGFYLVRVEGKRGGGIPAFPQVAERVKHVLLQEKRLTRLKLWVEEEKKAAKIQLMEAAS